MHGETVCQDPTFKLAYLFWKESIQHSDYYKMKRLHDIKHEVELNSSPDCMVLKHYGDQEQKSLLYKIALEGILEAWRHKRAIEFRYYRKYI